MSNLDQRMVLLASEDAAFLRQLTDRWQSERVVPTFVAAADAHAFHSNFDLAIVEHRVTPAPGCPAGRSLATLKALDKTSRPTLVLVDHEALAEVHRDFPRVLAVGRHETWPDTLVTLASEVLRRAEAVKRAERAEQLNFALKRNATLGQYVLDMRHSLNNALTSVLGNAELLLLEPGTFSAVAHSQLDTIRHMSLRVHEILQRFSSLEKELSFAEKQTQKDGGSRPIAAAAP
jgi:signal transduction histidine kinase